MEIITEISSNDLRDIINAGTAENIQAFNKRLDYYIMKLVLKALINNEYDITYLIQDIKDGAISLIDNTYIDEINDPNKQLITLKEGLYLLIE